MNRGMRRAVAMLLLTLAGCYSFRPADRSAVQAGASVRLSITEQESRNQVDRFGELRSRVEGTVRQTGPEGVGLTVPEASSPVDGGTRGFQSYIQIPWEGVTAVETKHFSWLRTGLLAAGGALVTLAILEVADGSGGGEGETPGPENQGVRIPLTLFR